MPIYEYKCQHCEHFFTKRHHIEDRHEPEFLVCPNCDRKEVKLGLYSNQAAPIGDAVRLGVRRPDEGFKDVLKEIHKNAPGSELNKTSRYI